MSICPKGKISKSRRDMRRAQSFRIPSNSLTACSKCGELMRAHRACRSCGSYNKREIITIGEKK